MARNTSPPTTPPAIAPALDFDLLVVDGVEFGIDALVLAIIADEDVAEALRSDNQGISFHLYQAKFTMAYFALQLPRQSYYLSVRKIKIVILDALS
jgi:hypothetical protein